MKSMTEPSRETPVVDEVDMLVVGGGPAGLTAAVGAARRGGRVALVERYGCLGGLATGGLVLHMMVMYDRAGKRWIGGLTWEILERLGAVGGVAYESPASPHVDSELLKIVADEMCQEAGVRLRLHSWAANVLVESGRVRGVITESKSGRQAILCRICIDASGDGDVAALAGAAYETGRMPIGLPLKVGGIDLEAFRAFERNDRDRADLLINEVRMMGGFRLQPRPTPYSDAGVYWINIQGLDRRDPPQGSEKEEPDGPAGELNPLSVEDLTYAEIDLRRRAQASLEYYRRHAPGFEKASLLAFASQLGVRDSRRIKGLHTLTKADVQAGKQFDDAIGCVVAISAPEGRYQIPYRCLVPEGIEGLLVAGRCISVDRWVANSARLIPPCMVTGQAAGAAAAMALQAGVPPANLEAATLRRQLQNDGVILD